MDNVSEIVRYYFWCTLVGRSSTLWGRALCSVSDYRSQERERVTRMEDNKQGNDRGRTVRQATGEQGVKQVAIDTDIFICGKNISSMCYMQAEWFTFPTGKEITIY